MAEFTVTYTSGEHESFIADGYEPRPGLLVFVAGGRDAFAVNHDLVEHVERIDTFESPFVRSFVVLCAVLLVVAAVPLVFVGLGDAFSAETVAARVFGGLLAGAAALCVIGAWGAWCNDERGLGRAFAAMVAVLLADGVLVGAWRLGKSANWVGPALVVYGLAALACSALLSRARVRPRWPGMVRNVATVSVALALIPFWFANEWAPANKTAALNVSVELAASPVVPPGTMPEFVTATISLANISGSKLRVVGTAVWGTGGLGEAASDHPGRLGIDVGNWLEPDQHDVEQIVFRVPDGAPPVVGVDVRVEVVKAERVPHGHRVDCPPGTCASALRIGEGSLVSRVTREHRYLVTMRDAAGFGMCVVRRPGPCPPRSGLDAVYGLVRIGAAAQVALPQATEPIPPR